VVKMRRFGWMERPSVIVLTVLVIGLTMQSVSTLTALVAAESQWATTVSMWAFGFQYWMLVDTWRSVWETTAKERVLWRAGRAVGEVVEMQGVTTGIDHYDRKVHLRGFGNDVWTGVVLQAEGMVELCMVMTCESRHQIRVEDINLVIETWQVDPEAALVTAQLVLQPARVLWLESAEVVW